jgi:FkbM family methyltransferase
MRLKVKRFAKDAAIATGLFRPAEWLYRTLVRPELAVKFKNDLAFYSRFIEPGDLCFDVGAHIGTKTEVFLEIGASVVAFEPQVDCYGELVARCKVFPRFRAVRSAMGQTPGRATMYINRRRAASSLRADWEEGVVSAVIVPVTTLDEAIAKYGVPRYCKIDVEGHSLQVLRGLSRPIRLISFEHHQAEFEDAVACLDYLETLGPFVVNIAPVETPALASPEWLKKDEFVTFYRRELSQNKQFRYGDIYIMTAEETSADEQRTFTMR